MSDPYKTPEANLTVDEPIEEGSELASRWQRLGGSILDGLISGIPAGFVFYQMGIYSRASPSGVLPLADLINSFVIGFVIFMLINGYLLYTQGQTVGKMIAGTRVVTLTGQQVSGNRYIFIRLLPMWVITQIPIIGSIVGLIDTLLIFRKEKNCLHDDIAGTRVVRA